mmetsp:Transcript_47926/g.144880  ORF Transcript_47926/g.144880 Transcript_47926/m.144880 type:complete len:180 (-) Transcript_47926:149-688(-)
MLASVATHVGRVPTVGKLFVQRYGQVTLQYLAARHFPIHWTAKNSLSHASDNTNITYSGGQASEGQGGFYGSGGARALAQPQVHDRPEMLALASDVEHLENTMSQLQTLEDILTDDQKENGGQVSNRSIEIRGKIKHLVTSPDFMDCLGRLEIMGEPCWGLSSEERDLVKFARAKVNQC